QSALALSYPDLAETLGASIANKVLASGSPCPDLVIGPAIGAILITQEVARAFMRRAMFAERINDHLALRRGFHVEDGANVLLVEDVMTTGGSIEELRQLIEPMGGNVIGFACIVDRMKEPKTTKPLHSLAHVKTNTWTS